MANTNIYPYGQGQTMPAGYPIANDLNTNDAQQALSAAMGYKLARTHWHGKKWWGFGTSITDVGAGTGKYAPYLASLSGMTFVDHGHGGKGITTAASSGDDVYDDIMAVTSSCDADLITLEVGANDHAAPLGTPYDALPNESVQDNSTLCGALNLCIRHLQEVTNAQIVVIGSPKGRYAIGGSPLRYGNEKWGSDNHTFLERDEAIRQVCAINSVYYLPPADGMGYARMNASNDYNVDQIHQTNLGGYNFAQAIWGVLKNIPLFYSTIPS